MFAELWIGTRLQGNFAISLNIWLEQSIACYNHFQFRTANCMVRVKNATQSVDSVLCKDAGLSEPDTLERCGGGDCPRWMAGEWTLCLQSRCINRNKAVQNRDVRCLYPNETESSTCDETERPLTKQECYNERCKPFWKVEKWSEVSIFHTSRRTIGTQHFSTWKFQFITVQCSVWRPRD